MTEKSLSLSFFLERRHLALFREMSLESAWPVDIKGERGIAGVYGRSFRSKSDEPLGGFHGRNDELPLENVEDGKRWTKTEG